MCCFIEYKQHISCCGAKKQLKRFFLVSAKRDAYSQNATTACRTLQSYLHSKAIAYLLNVVKPAWVLVGGSHG